MERIGEILVEMKACTPEELRAGLQTQTIFGGRIGTNLLELGIIDESQLAAALTRAFGIPCLTGDVEPDEGAIEAITPQLAERYGIVPLQVDDRRLKVVVSDPRNLATLDDLAFATGKTVEPVLAPEARLWSLMRRFYGIERHLRGLEVEDDLESAATARGGGVGIAAAPGDPFGERPRTLSTAEAIALIDDMSDPVVLSALLVRGAGGCAGRAVFLKCLGARAVAWLGAGRLPVNDIRGSDVPLERDGPFGAAVELRAPTMMPIRDSGRAAAFISLLGTPLPMNAFVAPVVLRGRAVALLYADAGPGATLRAESAELVRLTSALNRRFEALAPLSGR